jgi:CRISPR-associated endonuclease/helicase Cas3
MGLLAKPDKTLLEHIQDCLGVFKSVQRYFNPLAQQLAQKLALPSERLWQNAFYTVFFHDFGKGTTSFQRRVTAPEDKKPWAYSHALASVPFIWNAVWREPIRWKSQPVFFEALAVAAHHSPLHPNLFYDDYGKGSLQPNYLLDELQTLHRQLPTLFVQTLDAPLPATSNFPQPEALSNPFRVLEEQVKEPTFQALRHVSRREGVMLRELYAFFKGILHYCDWLGSGELKMPSTLDKIHERVEAGVRARNPQFIDWYDFQKKALFADQQSLLLQAPTGQGKTEAALLWTSSEMPRKILYLLPTMVTANRMRQRLQDYFGKDNIGLAHSAASYYLHKELERISPEDEREEWSRFYVNEILLSKTFIKPVTVATVDQLLYSFFNWRHWELITTNAAQAVVVLDEIHAYDLYTFGLILSALQRLAQRGARFVIMSATFPSFLEQRLKEVLGNNVAVVRDQATLQLKRHEIHLRNDTLESGLNEIVRDFRTPKAKKVLVICNTVGRSKEIFEALRKKLSNDERERVALFHSQFILRDRAKREEQLEQTEGPFLAVATQVVEVSLDVDFDVLYTEAAPPDALVQRLGRVNRKGDKGQVPAYIFRETENSHYIYNKDLIAHGLELIAGKASLITESVWKEIVEQVYDPKHLPPKVLEDFNEGLEIFATVQEQLSYLYDLRLSEIGLWAKTRKERYPTVEVVPIRFQKEIEAIEPWRRLEYTVRVPFYAVHGFLRYQPEESHLFVAEVQYDDDRGVVYKRDAREIESRMI